jgi:acyl-CoA reductase-like NAD-dependent aldehyde dehydrogenase
VTHAPAQAEEVGDELIAHPKVRRINFTGSTAVGRIIAEKAGRHLKRVLLELGGNAPLLILRDADLDYAVQKTAFGALLHQGQICMASSRIIVEQPIAEEFAARLARQVESMKAGDPHDPEVAIGPLVNQRAVERMQGLVDDAVAHGAQLLTGGQANGWVYQPTVLHQVTAKMRLYSEETFGPLVPLIVVRDDAEALQVANDTVYGLSAGIITRDFNKGLELAEQLETGKVHINDQSIYDEVHVPFGGMKDSGWGRFGGKAALEEFTELRTITVQRPPRA